MRPLDPLSSLKTQLGVVIVAAVGVTILVVALGVRAGLPLLVCGVAAGILALGMVQFLAHGMISPLREMAAAAGTMAKGDYGRRVTATSRDEVGELADSFNRMAAELAEVDRVRRDLVANVSHELRTPISALQALLENMIDGVEPPDRATLERMLKQVERLGRLVSQLLDLSRLESGVLPMQIGSFPLGTLLEEVIHESRMHAPQETKQVTVNLEVVPADLELHADAERIHQVMRNLLDNAIRHSPREGVVRLGAMRRRDVVVVTVADEGPGIPAGDVQRVFERFYRSEDARSSLEGGSGLGLAIARWITELHGGRIRAENNQPRGCRMVVELPQERLRTYDEAEAPALRRTRERIKVDGG